MTEQPAPIPPETTDWTFVVAGGCPECGFKPQDVRRTGDHLRATMPAWAAALTRPDARERPEPTTWSPVEYASHVRDTCRIFRGRLERMLSEDDPEFENWDQDAYAVQHDYFHADPRAVHAGLEFAASDLADVFDGVRPDQWQRTGRRSDGKSFTVETFAVYLLHDVMHHVADVAR